MGTEETTAALERALSDHFGHSPVRATVSFLGVEPVDVLRFEPAPGERAYVSLGMSRRPMTAASEYLLESDGPRAELMLLVRDERGVFDGVWRQLAVLAAAPAVEGVVYTPGMTVDTGQPLAPGSRCTGGLIDTSPLEPVATTGGTVDVLQLIPATSTELAWCRIHGSAALRQRWATQEVDLLDLGRRAVELT